MARITSRDTFMPPPVEPAQAPQIIKKHRIIRLNTGHMPKSSVQNPVVVITEETLKAAWCSALPTDGICR